MGYFKIRNEVQELKDKLQKKDEEIAELHRSLELTMSPGQCKSEFCAVCKHCRGLVNHRIVCEYSDEIPCNKFEPNKTNE